ncbi:polysaccharide lyase 6 family protein [Ferrimonas senticii]|uniref:polysaccharide lyase 6 family protein n=1 Tax=Ferrimonas senticii TaxID=394566 RepID=UPI00040A7E49|nr:polysaccharide lyase 6 family protein [Ferrimonas senticii]
MPSLLRPVAVLISVLLCGQLVACGGGGGGDVVDPTPDLPDLPDPEQPNPNLPAPDLAPIPSSGIVVNTIDELNAELGKANHGEVILLADGEWPNLQLTIDRDNLIIAAQTVGQVRITGDSTVEVNGDNVRLDGLYWDNATPEQSNGLVVLNGNNNTLSNSTIVGAGVNNNPSCTGGDHRWVSLKGKQHQVVSNRFDGKCGKGVLLTVWRQSGKTDEHLISHNLFRDYHRRHNETNGFEGIRIGTSDSSQSDSNTVVQYNLFERINGEIEIISSKSGGNHYRFNTFRNSDGLLTLRHGKDNVVENNLFLQSGSEGGGGIRVFDSGHRISNNYISGVDTTSNSRGGIVLHAGLNKKGSEPSYSSELNKQWTANNISVSNNTVIDSDHGLYHNAYLASSTACENGAGKDVPCNPSWNVRFSGNWVYHRHGVAVKKDNGTAIIDGQYQGERYWGSSGAGHSGAGINTSKPPVQQDPTSGLLSSLGAGADLTKIVPLFAADVGPRAR